MSPKDTSAKLNQTIELLSDYESYQTVCHQHTFGEPMPSIRKLEEIVILLRDIIFPGYFGDTSADPTSVKYYIGVNIQRVHELLSEQILSGICFACEKSEEMAHIEKIKIAQDISLKFIESLPEIRRVLTTDVVAAYNGDPAATSYGEVIFCYPTIKALTNYRIAHQLHKLGVPLIPRIITEMAHSETGIDIHPHAQIGESFTIDHGTGVVIGATAIIGKNVKLFQGVTLGARNFPRDANGNPIKGIPRHPIVEDDVIIYSNASILGRITVGKGSIIGGNIWLTNDVPEGSRILQNPEK